MNENQTITRNTRFINGPYTGVVRDTDDILNIDTTLGPVNLSLQNIRGSGLMLNPRCIFINDTGNQVSINPITIYGSAGDLVNSGPSVVINTNGANAKCNIANAVEWSVTGVGAGGGGGDKNFVYTQGIPSDTWIVNHMLGKRVSVSVVAKTGVQIQTYVEWVNNNTVIIKTNGLQTGFVYCN